MEIKVCVGSACYVKGSHQVIQKIQNLIKHYNLEEKVDLKAAFCIGKCTGAVSLQIDGEVFGIEEADTEAFFNDVILRRLKSCK